MQNIPINRKNDPWETRQEIIDVKIEIHCSRYWILSEWECENLSLPFWRIYHSRIGGSFVQFKNTEVELTDEKLVLIPPYTAFSSFINTRRNLVESIKGVKIEREEQIEQYKKIGFTDQLFIHFNLGYPYDKIPSQIFIIPLNEYWKGEVKNIENERLSSPNIINFYSSMQLNNLVLHTLKMLIPELWKISVPDKRIAKVITYINENIGEELLNNKLSEIANLAPNSFTRLFKKVIEMTVHQYIQQKRIQKAIMLLYHSTNEIDEIAFECGFCDRHHFSNVFKMETGYSPAKFRQRL